MKSNSRNIFLGKLENRRAIQWLGRFSLLLLAPFESPIGADEKLIRDKKKYGNLEEPQPFAHEVQERRLVMFERTLSHEFS